MRYLDWFGDGSLVLLDLALACCAIETDIARPAEHQFLDEVPSGAKVVITVSGTLTNALAEPVAATIAAHSDAVVVAVGGCACVGGPYWDSYSVTKGVDQLVQVHHYVPGCPPVPEAISQVLEKVRNV